ncbi:MAG: porin family protein [Bacteroidota bacterium]
MNKKIIRVIRVILFTALLMTAFVSHGQTLAYGVFGGLTASQVDGDTYTGFNKLGLNAGGFVNRYIEFDIYWQAELKYVSRGVYKGPGDFDPTLYRSTYHYLEIPLSAHYLYDEKIQLELGISPEVLLGTVFRDENGALDPSTYPENRRFGLSVFAGLGYWFSPSTGVNLRYTNSAIPFRDPQEWNHPRYKGYFHNVISLSLAFRIRRS